MVNWVIILLASFKWIAFYVIYHFDWDIALWAYIYYFFLGNQIGWYLFIGYHPCNMFWYWTHHLYVALLLLGTCLTKRFLWRHHSWLKCNISWFRPGILRLSWHYKNAYISFDRVSTIPFLKFSISLIYCIQS